MKEALDNGQFTKATTLWDETEDVISKSTNGVSFYNILWPQTEEASKGYRRDGKHSQGTRKLATYHSDTLSTLMNGKIKETLRIIPANVSWGGQSKLVFDALAEDFMKPVVRVVESLLNSTSIAVNVYSGQLDLIVDTVGELKDGLAWDFYDLFEMLTGWVLSL